MKPETISLGALVPDARNARKHNPRNLDMVERSLQEVGAARSIVIDENNRILAGNGTVEAAGNAGFANVRVIEASGAEIIAVRRTGLTEEQKTKLALYDNRTAELAEWEASVLAELNEEVDLSAMWSEGEMEALLAAANTDGSEMPEEADDIITKPSAKPIVKRGDVFCLGNHRLMCGDSTNSDDVAKLMNGKKAKLYATDPPYGVNYVKAKAGIPRSGYETIADDYNDIEGDNFQDKELQDFLESVFASWLPFLDNAAWYMWHAHLTQGFFAAAAAAADVILHRQIIWAKSGFNLTRSGMYHWAHEPCFYGWQKGKQPAWYGAKNQRSVWEIDRTGTKNFHPTQKPTEIFAIPIRNHLRKGEVCAEPFAGSGSQIVAAESEGVHCYAMEISEAYCEGIIRRYFQTFPMQSDKFRHENGNISLDDILSNGVADTEGDINS